jgi:alkylation response protein AidB-like acyl-CoA dehydrogenase
MLGNTLIHLGTEEQKKHYLPRILSGEQRWCQGYSEPDAGSDLAGIRTSAVLDGEEWVINGQKTWTSAGHLADHIFVLARTDPRRVKHRGISFLLVPMDQPGVEVRPIRNMAGYALFNEVFFTDARTGAARSSARSTTAGAPRWRCSASSAASPRRPTRSASAPTSTGCSALARERGVTNDARIRDRLAWCHSRVEVMRFRGYQALTRSLSGRPAGTRVGDQQDHLERVRAGLHRAGDRDPRTRRRSARPGQATGGMLQMPRPGTENSAAVVGRDLHGGPGRHHLRRQLADPAQHHRRAAARPAQGAAPGQRPVPRAREVRRAETVDFAFSADQDEFRTSLRRFLADKAPLSAVRAAGETDGRLRPELWKQMSTQLGLPGLHLPEEHGGSGTGCSSRRSSWRRPAAR